MCRCSARVTSRWFCRSICARSFSIFLSIPHLKVPSLYVARMGFVEWILSSSGYREDQFKLGANLIANQWLRHIHPTENRKSIQSLDPFEMQGETEKKESRSLQLRVILQGGKDERIALFGISSLRSEKPKGKKRTPNQIALVS